MRIFLRLVSTAVALAVAAQLFAGIRFNGPAHGSAEIQHKLLPLIVVAAIMTVVITFVKPVVTFFSIPLIILTLGLFLLVINAIVLKLTGALAHLFGIGFHVQGFWPAVGGALVITIVTAVVDRVIGADDQPKRRSSRNDRRITR